MLNVTTNRLQLAKREPLRIGHPSAPDKIPAQLRLLRKAARREMLSGLKETRRTNDAIKHLGKLPGPGESLHFVIDGRFEPCDLIPAIRRLADPAGDAIIKHLTICTLGFNRDNIALLCRGIDQGKIGGITLVCSHYFEKSDKEDYAFTVDEIVTRRGGRVFALRMHAKIILLEMSDGTTYTVEGSGNLRSCTSIEQFCLTNDRPLLEFHRNWIESYIASIRGAKK